MRASKVSFLFNLLYELTIVQTCSADMKCEFYFSNMSYISGSDITRIVEMFQKQTLTFQVLGQSPTKVVILPASESKLKRGSFS